VASSTSVSAGTLTTLATAPQSAVVVPTTSAGPIAVTASTQAPPPSVAVPAYAVLDASSGQWLALDHADDPRPVGSIMKLLTTYVAMQAGSPDQLVTVPPLELDPEESSIGLRPGEQLSRAVLIRAMLIVSANDAARTIALDLGGTTDAFVGLMNQAAKDLGLTQTVAANPIGLDADGAHSSARDMATLAARLMRDTTFQETVRRRTAKLHGTTYSTTNDLLKTYQGADGIKTGHTTDAAYCLVGSATRNGRRLIVVVLGATSNDARVKAAAALLDWAFRRT
jgi:D-alanyl-D-alanine carboxypeptidase